MPQLSQVDVRKFIRLCAEDRNFGEFQIYLGLDKADVIRLKGTLGIMTPRDAKDLLKDVVVLEEKEEAVARAERQVTLNEERKAAQARLDAQNLKKQQERSEKKRKVLSVTKVKNQDKKRQEKFEKQQEKTAAVKAADTLKKLNKTAWQIPPELSPEQFKRDLVHRGVRFICDRYNVTRSDIMSEVTRLKLKIDFDLLPR
jgi:hypothetical protein